jgi:hypothetical protein
MATSVVAVIVVPASMYTQTDTQMAQKSGTLFGVC